MTHDEIWAWVCGLEILVFFILLVRSRKGRYQYGWRRGYTRAMRRVEEGLKNHWEYLHEVTMDEE